MFFSELEFSSICAAVLCARTGGKTLDNFIYFFCIALFLEKKQYMFKWADSMIACQFNRNKRGVGVLGTLPVVMKLERSVETTGI